MAARRAAGRGETLVSGGSIPGLARAAFTVHRSASPRVPVLIAVPHAGRAYPSDFLCGMRNPGAAPLRLEDRFVDHVAREAADLCGARLIVAHAPRAMIDLNRDPRDLDLGMFTAGEDEKAAMRRAMPHGGAQSARSLRGLGLFPRRISGLGELWRAPMRPVEASRRIAAIHAPYHEAIDNELASIREEWAMALLVDLHSMPDLPARHAGAAPATHVLGDRFGASCARVMAEAGMAALEFAGVEAAYNRPYAGGYVLDRHGKPRGGVHAVQLEIARSLYLDGDRDQPGAGVSTQARIVADLVAAMVAAISGLEAEWPQAAE